MKIRWIAIVAGLVLCGGAFWQFEIKEHRTPPSAAALLPAEEDARQALNTTQRHREWVNLPVGGKNIRVFVVYPERADKAPVAVITANEESASARVRAMALKAAEEGYIAVVPDLLSGMAPNGGDSDSFPDSQSIANALKAMSKDEIAKRSEAARRYAVSLQAATGQSAVLNLNTDASRIAATVEEPVAGASSAKFALSAAGWSGAMAFMTLQTNNHPQAGVNPNMPEDHDQHMGHIGMAMAQAPDAKKGPGPPRGYPVNKLPELPAGVFTARTTLLDSKLRKEFVDIPYGNMKLHTWVEYPAGEGKAPIVMVMQHGPGMDDWQRALADQLAQDGFIAIAVDLHSGLGANGGAYDSFRGTDEVMRATARINQDEMQNRYKAGLEWGKKLPRWNGRAASIGFCMGGGNSFRFAGEVPDLNAAVTFYGGNPSEEVMAKIKAPVLAFYGEDDARVTAGAEPAKLAMDKLGKKFEYRVYPHATHGFLEFQDLAGNPAATADSWNRTIEFLKKYTF